MDAWTRNHLQEYADHVAYDDERDAFIAYVERSVEDDPTIVDLGWPILFEGFRKGSWANDRADGLTDNETHAARVTEATRAVVMSTGPRVRGVTRARPVVTRQTSAKVPCLGCGKSINAKYTLCGPCAEDMGYARRPK